MINLLITFLAGAFVFRALQFLYKANAVICTRCYSAVHRFDDWHHMDKTPMIPQVEDAFYTHNEAQRYLLNQLMNGKTLSTDELETLVGESE